MEAIGFVLPTGVAGGVAALAFVEGVCEANNLRDITIFGHPALQSLTKRSYKWIDIGGDDPRQAMLAALDVPRLDRCFSLGCDFFGEAIALVTSHRSELLSGPSLRVSAIENWVQSIGIPVSLGLPDWVIERTKAAPDVILVPGRSSTSRWADDEWPDDQWLELATSLALDNLQVGVLTLEASQTGLALARLPGIQVLPDDLPLPTMVGVLHGARVVITSDEGIANLAATVGVPTVLIQPAGVGEGWYSKPSTLHRLQPGPGTPLAALEVTYLLNIIKKIQVPLAYF